MKLVEILARDLKVWPKNNRGNDGITQDEGGNLNSLDAGCEPSFHEEDKCWEACSHSYLEDTLEEAEDFATAVVTKAQWQAERDKQKGCEWKRHRGGKQPVADGVLVEVKLRDGDIQQHYAEGFAWPFTDCDVDANILKYRVISQPQAEEVEMKGPFVAKAANQESTEIVLDDFIESGTWHEDQVDGPIKWRDTVNELDAYIEEFTRERESLINRLALEGVALIPAIAAVMGVADELPTFRDWMVGDIVEVISTETFARTGLRVGDQMPIVDTDSRDGTVKVVSGSWGDEDNYKFIRRP